MKNRDPFADLQARDGPSPTQDGPDTDTVRGLLLYCRGWLTGEVSAEALHNPCWAMSARLRGAAEATFRDLDKNPDLGEETRGPIFETGEGYEAVAAILEDLPTLAQENRREEFEEALADFETERQAVAEATEEVEAQMREGVPRCPRCGESGPNERCDTCRLVQLYPDPNGLRDYSHKSAHLSALHVRVFQAYLAVIQGEQSLEGLFKTLPPLLAHLRELSAFCDAQEATGEAFDLVDSLRADIESARAGVKRLQEVAGSYLTSDLHRGWEDIFESSVAIAEHLRRFAVATGEIEESHPQQSDGLQLGLR